jgi:hypothetical protein
MKYYRDFRVRKLKRTLEILIKPFGFLVSQLVLGRIAFPCRTCQTFPEHIIPSMLAGSVGTPGRLDAKIVLLGGGAMAHLAVRMGNFVVA